jgi:hypothetical protein
MSEETEYAFRSNAFVNRRRYRLTDDAMVWEEDGKPLDGVFYDDISEIRLAFAPTRWSTNRFRARIIFREGGMAELFNMDYIGIGNFNALDAQYNAFLRDLHRRLADRGTATVYRLGNSTGGYIANWLLIIFIAAMLALIFVFLFTIGLGPLALVKLVVILFFVPVLIRYIRRAKPGTYDPRAIPDAVLPAVEGSPSAAPA